MSHPSVTDDHFLTFSEEVTVELDPVWIQRILRTLKADPHYEVMVRRIITENDTVVGRGACPFPLHCRNYKSCRLHDCNADELDLDGYAIRRG